MTGDGDFVGPFLEPIIPRIRRYVVRAGFPGTDPDDLVQAALIYCWKVCLRSRPHLSGESPEDFFRRKRLAIWRRARKEAVLHSALLLSAKGRPLDDRPGRTRRERTLAPLALDSEIPSVDLGIAKVEFADEIDFLSRRFPGQGWDLLMLIQGWDPRGPMTLTAAYPLVGLRSRQRANDHLRETIRVVREFYSSSPSVLS